ncbi:MAG: hypothetical protein GTN69_11295 [Armatimonadetes bacterium]|nr:hypothetical protein [Armatimonadota bacterium]NIO76439.1 hypothetical protein [Armatimonadota bacterium]NIO98159.1 hypothetical protein [Armatimonadota bacterium]
MNRLLNLFNSRPTLIVSLPSNSPTLAKAAKEGGADALKVHIHIHHEASGTHFGSLAEERSALEQILALGLPTGIVVAAGETAATPEEMSEILTMGFDAFDAYAHHLPAWMLSLDGIAKIVAVDENSTAEIAGDMESLGVDVLEAAVVPVEGYRRPLMLRDLLHYRVLREAVSIPIVIPTQRSIRPEDVSTLFGSCRPNALMIGAVVTGGESDSVGKATERFKKALTDLPKS